MPGKKGGNKNGRVALTREMQSVKEPRCVSGDARVSTLLMRQTLSPEILVRDFNQQNKANVFA